MPTPYDDGKRPPGPPGIYGGTGGAAASTAELWEGLHTKLYAVDPGGPRCPLPPAPYPFPGGGKGGGLGGRTLQPGPAGAPLDPRSDARKPRKERSGSRGGGPGPVREGSRIRYRY
jgi:hypothetical protein